MFEEGKREVGLFSGVQGGKTIFGSFVTRNVIEDIAQPGDNILIGAPTYKILSQATLPTFLKLHSRFVGTYNGQDNVFRTHKGVNIWFRTGTDPDSVEGIPDCIFAWMDEAGKCPRKFWVNFHGRVARRQGAILYTSTWYALNWMFKELWKPFVSQRRDDIFITAFNSAENPSFPKEELERQRMILSPAEFQRKYLGEPGKVDGMIYYGFGDQNFCDPFETTQMPIYGGVDWGFDHPMAIMTRVFPGDGSMYTNSIFKRSGLSTIQQLDIIEAKHKLFRVKHWYCGHDRPDMIAELNKRGIPASNYFESRPDYREVNAGNQLHAEYVHTGKYKIMRKIDQIEDLEDEYLSYAWKEYEEDQEGKEKPVNVNDDLMAVDRYITINTHHLLKKEKDTYKLRINRTKIDDFDPEKKEMESWA